MHTCADTTDVQEVTATVLDKDLTMLRIRCLFITGSDARGCMVTLVAILNGVETYTVNLTRQSNSGYVTISESVILSISLSITCYDRVFAYDIEEDGSIGSLRVPGELRKPKTLRNEAACSTQTNASPSQLHFMLYYDWLVDIHFFPQFRFEFHFGTHHNSAWGISYH